MRIDGRQANRYSAGRIESTPDERAALDVATGKVIGQCRRRHRATALLQFLRIIDSNVPADLDVHVIIDRLTTPKTAAVQRWVARHPRFHVHFTPTYRS